MIFSDFFTECTSASHWFRALHTASCGVLLVYRLWETYASTIRR